MRASGSQTIGDTPRRDEGSASTFDVLFTANNAKKRKVWGEGTLTVSHQRACLFDTLSKAHVASSVGTGIQPCAVFTLMVSLNREGGNRRPTFEEGEEVPFNSSHILQIVKLRHAHMIPYASSLVGATIESSATKRVTAAAVPSSSSSNRRQCLHPPIAAAPLVVTFEHNLPPPLHEPAPSHSSSPGGVNYSSQRQLLIDDVGGAGTIMFTNTFFTDMRPGEKAVRKRDRADVWTARSDADVLQILLHSHPHCFPAG